MTLIIKLCKNWVNMEKKLNTVKDLIDYLSDNNKNNLDWKISGHLLFVMPDITQKKSIPMLSMSGHAVSVLTGLCELTTQVFNILKKDNDSEFVKEMGDLLISKLKLNIGSDNTENSNVN